MGGASSAIAGRGCAAPAGVPRQRRFSLAEAIESQIVPRLVVRRSPPGILRPPAAMAELVIMPQDAMDLADLAMRGDDHCVRQRVQDASARQSMEAVCLDLLSPAARYLGALWEEDLCSFTDVTLGMLRLQDALHVLTADSPAGHIDGFRRHRIALASAPGEHHSFGLSMVGTFFQKAGWAVTVLHDSTLPDLAALLRREWFGVLGISVGSEARLERLAAVLPRLRDVSRNGSLSVMVGGPIFLANPELAAQIGADATAADGIQATWVAENLLAERSASAERSNTA
jgi:methanogenic corrinoid protein MtbC1